MKKRFFKTLVSSVLALSMGFGLVGCGNDSDSKSANADYAVILKTLSNDFWATMKKGIEDKAKELGVSVDIFAAQDVYKRQVHYRSKTTASERSSLVYAGAYE